MVSLAALRTPQSDDKKQITPRQQLDNVFQKHKTHIANALPAHLSADRMIRLALTQFSQNAELAKCDALSIFASVIVGSQLGLEIGIMGQGYLVPYKGRCTFVPGWQGLVDLVTRSGRASVYTGVIYKDQKYTFTDGARRDLVIHNESELDDELDITHVYAIGWVSGAQMPVVELWPISKVKRHRDRFNKVGDKHYSFRNFEMYARKVPLLQVIKYLPKSVELSNALALDRASEEGRNLTIDGDQLVTDFGSADKSPFDHEGNAELGVDEPSQMEGMEHPDIDAGNVDASPDLSAAPAAQATPAPGPEQSALERILEQMDAVTDATLLGEISDQLDALSPEEQDVGFKAFRARRARLRDTAPQQATLAMSLD